MSRPRGSVSVEYMLLLCSAASLAMLTGAFLKVYGMQLADRVLERVLDAVLTLAGS